MSQEFPAEYGKHASVRFVVIQPQFFSDCSIRYGSTNQANSASYPQRHGE